MHFFETEGKWTIALYEKRFRVYNEIGVFFEENNVLPEEAFEAFSEIVSASPPFQAVEYLAGSLPLEEGERTPEYELRLIDPNSRVVATVLWDHSVVKECLDHYLALETKQYDVRAKISLTLEEAEIDPELWDWETLVLSGRVKVCFVEAELVPKEEASE